MTTMSLRDHLFGGLDSFQLALEAMRANPTFSLGDECLVEDISKNLLFLLSHEPLHLNTDPDGDSTEEDSPSSRASIVDYLLHQLRPAIAEEVLRRHGPHLFAFLLSRGEALLMNSISTQTTSSSNSNSMVDTWDRFPVLQVLADFLCFGRSGEEGSALASEILSCRFERVQFFGHPLTPLEIACLSHYFRGVELLLNRFPQFYNLSVINNPSLLPLLPAQDQGKNLLEILLDYSQFIHNGRRGNSEASMLPKLLCTVFKDDARIVHVLVENGFNASFVRSHPQLRGHYSALHQAIHTGNAEVLRALLEVAPDLVKDFSRAAIRGAIAADNNTVTAHYTATASSSNITQLLGSVSPRSQYASVPTPLELACTLPNDNVSVVRLIVQYNIVSSQGGPDGLMDPPEEFSCLSMAVKAQNFEVASYLVSVIKSYSLYDALKTTRQNGDSWNGTDELPPMPQPHTEQDSDPEFLPLGSLHPIEAAMCEAIRVASSHCDMRFMLMLHEEGECDLSACDGRKSFLSLSLECPNALLYLIENGADPNAYVEQEVSFLSIHGHYLGSTVRCTVLHIAVLKGLFDSVSLLLSCPRTDVNVRDSCGRTPAAMLGAAYDAYTVRRYSPRQQQEELSLLSSLITVRAACVRDIEGFPLLSQLLLRDKQWHVKLQLGAAPSQQLSGGNSTTSQPRVELTSINLAHRFLDIVQFTSSDVPDAPEKIILSCYHDQMHTLPYDILSCLRILSSELQAEKSQLVAKVQSRLSAIYRDLRLSRSSSFVTLSELSMAKLMAVMNEKRILVTGGLSHNPVKLELLTVFDLLSNSSSSSSAPMVYEESETDGQSTPRPSPPMRLFPDCEGTLLKQSDWLREWRPRYMVLYQCFLFVCPTAGDNPTTVVSFAPAVDGSRIALNIEKLPRSDSAYASLDSANWDDSIAIPSLHLSNIYTKTAYKHIYLRSVWTGVTRDTADDMITCEIDLRRWVTAIASVVTMYK